MKQEVINIIKILGIGLNEITVDIDLGYIVANSIELIPIKNDIIIHSFMDDLDIEFNFDELDSDIQEEIYRNLSKLVYN